ncbi:MAG: MATE family efflux transporter [Eubacteriales bacterium]|nr:MATE family efflux transporter [Eubacteriales bacterium]
MLEEPVSKLILKFAAPTIVSMLVTAIYNMADTFFVSQISTSASGAVGIIFSLMAILQAFAFMIGMGSGNNIARLLGQQKQKQAEIFAAVCFVTEFLAGTLIAAILLPNLNRVVYLLGATDTIAPYAMDYAKYILFAAPFLMCSLGMNNMLRFQGNAFYAMMGIATGGILNMILDPLFIFGFGMGISGAAIATGLSQLISFIILTCQCNLRKSCLSIRLSNFRPSGHVYRAILTNGFPSLSRQGIASVAVIIMNFAAKPYGDAAIAAMSIVSRYGNFLNSAVIGFGQGFQPVCGFNYGAGNYKRVLDAFDFCVRTAVRFLLGLAVISFLFAPEIIAVFRKEDAEVVAIGTLALRAQAVSLMCAGYLTMANMFTQTIGYSLHATIVSLLRQGIWYIPLILVLPQVFGLWGIVLAQPAADFLSFVTAHLICRRVIGQMREKIV